MSFINILELYYLFGMIVDKSWSVIFNLNLFFRIATEKIVYVMPSVKKVLFNGAMRHFLHYTLIVLIDLNAQYGLPLTTHFTP